MARIEGISVLHATHALLRERRNHIFAFAAEAGPHFAVPRGRKAESTQLAGYNLDGLPTRIMSPIQVLTGPALINFVNQTNVANHYTTPPVIYLQ